MQWGNTFLGGMILELTAFVHNGGIEYIENILPLILEPPLYGGTNPNMMCNVREINLNFSFAL